jgi:hypothetical protein
MLCGLWPRRVTGTVQRLAHMTSGEWSGGVARSAIRHPPVSVPLSAVDIAGRKVRRSYAKT